MMTTSCEEHLPSTKVASSNVDSTTTSVCGGDVGSRSSAERSPPSAGVLVSSPSHDRSVDFMHHDVVQSATQKWSSTRLLESSEKTYKVDRTTVTVGAPRMLTMLTMLASVAASSPAWASFGCSMDVAGEGFCLPSSTDACELTTPVPCCADSGTASPVVGGRLTLLSVAAPTVSQAPSSSYSTGSEGGMSCNNISSTISTKYSWEVLDYTS
jgi:hypothetical protein